jgi:RTX calcium-binding nonapeptide repeat (4 copies)
MNRRTTHLAASAIVLVCALAATLLTAGPASAASRGFKIYNLSSHPLKLNDVDQVPRHWFDFEGRPPDGDVLKPGAPPHDWEVKWVYLTHYGAKLTYDIVGTDKQYVATMTTNGGGVNQSDCQFPSKLGSCSAEGQTLTVTDPPGTEIDIPSGRGQEQAETLRDLCKKTRIADCRFDLGRRDDKALTPNHLVGKPQLNCTDHEDEASFEESDKVGQTNSLEISSETEFDFGFIKEKVIGKYGHDWTTEHEFKFSRHIPVPGKYMAWVTDAAPILRDWGNFTVTLGNTTWKLTDVYFDSPDLTDRAPKNAGGWTHHELAMTQQQLADLCPENKSSGGLQRAPASLVPMDWKGTGRADTLLGGPESHTVRGFAGNDVIRGGRGHDALDGGRGNDTLDGGRHNDTLDGGPGNDILDGGPGRDTLEGGPGADTMIDRSGPTVVETGPNSGPGTDTVDVRDGRGDDTVICGSRSSTVIVDAGDSAIGRCGKVSRSGTAPPIPR